jgi:hypothetical protein
MRRREFLSAVGTAAVWPAKALGVAVPPTLVCTENLNPDVVVMKSAKDWV